LTSIEFSRSHPLGLKLILIGIGVACMHLMLLWWTQVSPHPKPILAEPIQFHILPATPRPVDQNSIAPLAASRLKTMIQPTKQITPVPTKISAPQPKPVQMTSDQPNLATTSKSESTAILVQESQQRPEPGTTQSQGVLSQQITRQLPSSSTDYLNNQNPSYPAMSRRLGEQGTVVMRVLIGKNGTALQAEIDQSSHFERLDQAALQAVFNWRYSPGKINGQAQDMWFKVPVHFTLN
jgi:protein TonB